MRHQVECASCLTLRHAVGGIALFPQLNASLEDVPPKTSCTMVATSSRLLVLGESHAEGLINALRPSKQSEQGGDRRRTWL